MYGIRICSFHDADGEVTDFRGRVWRFEFSKMFGPLLVGETGVVLKNQTMTEAFWEAFYDWYEAKYGELGWRKDEREFAAELASCKYVRIGNSIVPRSMVPADVLAEIESGRLAGPEGRDLPSHNVKGDESDQNKPLQSSENESA